MWNLRNPLQNFRAYVIGVQDRNYKLAVVHGNPDPLVVQRNDVNEAGFQVTKPILESGLQLPFASYSGKHVVWYAGFAQERFRPERLSYDLAVATLAFALTTDLAILVQLTLVTGA